MKPEESWEKLPFKEAIAFFRQKVNIPSARWNDLWQDQHAKGFMVAGAVKAELLADFRTAVDKAIADGTTLAAFQKDFDKTVARHGWSHNGQPGWRAEMIYGTNIRTAYAAGRWQQMTEPATARLRPYLEYRHGDSVRPRPKHLAWDGLVLAIDDPFWQTHYPPNGWGCHCRAFSLSARDLARLGKTGPDNRPEVTTRTWTDKKTGRTEEVPDGIDPGWAYNVGMAGGKSYKALVGQLDRLEPPVARRWMDSIIREPAFDRFFSGKIGGEFPVAVLRESDRELLGSSSQTVWLSQETLKKNLDHHPELTIEDYRMIPEIIDNGEVYRQADERFVYLKKGGVMYRAALKRTRDGSANFFLSLFRNRETNAELKIRQRLERIR